MYPHLHCDWVIHNCKNNPFCLKFYQICPFRNESLKPCPSCNQQCVKAFIINKYSFEKLTNISVPNANSSVVAILFQITTFSTHNVYLCIIVAGYLVPYRVFTLTDTIDRIKCLCIKMGTETNCSRT